MILGRRYEEFFELLSRDEDVAADSGFEFEMECVTGDAGEVGDGSAACGVTLLDPATMGVAPTRQRSRVKPHGEEQLQALYQVFKAEELRQQSAIEEAEREQYERARQRLSDQFLNADFSWMQQARTDGWANPKQMPCVAPRFDEIRTAHVDTRRMSIGVWCAAPSQWESKKRAFFQIHVDAALA